MPPVLLYLLKVSISLSVVWLFYQLLLRRLTFYTLNRWYLLGYSVLSFFIPLINIYPILRDEALSGEPYLIQFIPVVGSQGHIAAVETHNGIGGWALLLWVIALGTMALLVRTAIRGWSLYRLRKSARLIEGGPLRIYQVDASIIPFSFGNSIYINQDLHSRQQWSDIILHEYVHIRQRHTLDILLTELICMLNWYNPFSWLMRWSIRQNLEFIADQQVLGSGVDRKGYQYHLLTVLGEVPYRLANNFNFSSLKKRIVMMNKIRSARLHLLKFLFVLPLAAVLMVAFRDKYTGLWQPSTGEVYVNVAGVVIDVSTQEPVAGATVNDQAAGLQAVTDDRGYFKLHIPVRADSVRIHLVYSKAGYKERSSETYFPAVKATKGMINVITMENPIHPLKGFYMEMPYMKVCPVDPVYEDVQAALASQKKDNRDMGRYMEMEKSHPEVSSFYITEDKQRRIVFHKDGTMEKYGYPGERSLAEMDKKYGTLPDFMRANDPQVNAGYLARWAEISGQAAAAFRPAGGDAQAIVFPGDSRVVVVSADGKTRVYDMDNDAAKERPAFESRYGKLPACVPAAGFNSDLTEGRAGVKATGDAAGAGGGASPGGTIARVAVRDTSDPRVILSGLRNDLSHLLYVLNGEKMPEGWKPDSISPDKIAAIDVVKGEQAVRLFGTRGANGVIAIMLKEYQLHFELKDTLNLTDKNGEYKPVYVLDGKEVTAEIVGALNPERIEAVSVHKGDEVTRSYGDKGKNGVIVITLKKEVTIFATHDGQVAATMNTKDGPMTVIGDTLRINKP